MQNRISCKRVSSITGRSVHSHVRGAKSDSTTGPTAKIVVQGKITGEDLLKAVLRLHLRPEGGRAEVDRELLLLLGLHRASCQHVHHVRAVTLHPQFGHQRQLST